MASFRMHRSARCLATALYALAALLIGFAHGHAGPVERGLTAAALPDLSAYRMPDGSLPVLCLTGNPDAGGGMMVCEACLVAAGHLLPPATIALTHVRTSTAVDPPRVAAQFVVAPDRSVRTARGPPNLVV